MSHNNTGDVLQAGQEPSRRQPAPMAVEVYQHHDPLLSTTKATRDVLPDASVTSNSVLETSGALSMQKSSQATSTLGSTAKKRRPSKVKTGRSLARSVSTPQLRGHVMSDIDADKKRNKLGYQRISIACGKPMTPKFLHAETLACITCQRSR